MEQKRVYRLPPELRLLGYPFQLHSIGWMPRHLYFHDHTILTEAFVCLSMNQEEPSETIINGRRRATAPGTGPHFSLLLPGTTLQTLKASVHDELFFQYPAECVPALATFFGPEFMRAPELTPHGFPEMIIAEIRSELARLPEPGCADRLDQLAIRLFTEIMIRHRQSPEQSGDPTLKLHSIAAGLAAGTPLPALLKKYAMSERTFYREWEKRFAQSPHQYRLARQLERAAALLAGTDCKVSAIGRDCGFTAPVGFHQRFRRLYGCSPLEYRKAARLRLLPESEPPCSETSGQSC